MAYFSPILAAPLVGLTMATVSFALPKQLSDPSLPSALFAELDPAQPTPEVSITATRVGDGWRLDLHTKNWIFTELCGRTIPATPEGHAHIYLDDRQIGTATLPVYYIDALPDDQPHLITVSMRAADHRVLVADGQVITANVVLTQ